MDSINRQQEEKNHQDLAGGKAAEKIKELSGKNDTCFFCTGIKKGQPLTARPMAVQKVDDEGNLWFLSASDSHKNADIMEDDRVQLMFQGSAHSDFMTLYGTATITRDKEKIKELWTPLAKAWFTEGQDDPRVTVIRVSPVEGYYWDNKHGNAIAFIKTAVGAMIGKTMDDSIEGKLKV